jgi:hypothetical protein
MAGFLCRKQALPCPGIRTEETSPVPGSLADAASPAELEEKDREKEDGGIRIEQIRVRGTLSEEAVRRVLEAALKEWSGDTDLSGIRGTLVLALTVEADGRVTHAWVQNKEAFKEGAMRVLLERARGLAFPKTKVRSYVHVSVSFPM